MKAKFLHNNFNVLDLDKSLAFLQGGPGSYGKTPPLKRRASSLFT